MDAPAGHWRVKGNGTHVGKIGSVTADGAYDTRKFYDAIVARKAHAVIVPHKNTKLLKPPSHGLKANHGRAMGTLSVRAQNETV